MFSYKKIAIILGGCYTDTVAYLGFHFGGGGGGVQNIFVKVGVFAAARGEVTRLLGGFGGMLPREKCLKWCNFVRFREYFVKIL